MERLKHILIIVGAIILGAFVNGFILRINGTIIPLPEGVDMKTPEGLQAAMKVLKPIHFLAPFLAHAIGTLIPAFIIAYFIPLRPKLMAIMTGGVFLVGGIMMVIQIPGAPMWFNILDLVLAYIPMGLLGYYLANRLMVKSEK